MNEDARADNPWGASPSYSERMSALQAEQELHHTHHLQDIAYSTEPGTLTNERTPSRREASSSTIVPDDTTMDADTYTARLRDILGSDADGDAEQIKGVNSYTRPNGASNAPVSDESNNDETSFQYSHQLPEDASFNTTTSRVRRPSTSSSSRLFAPRSISGNGLSSMRFSTSGGVESPQRPAAYPSLSRLRASVSKTASFAIPRHLQSGSSSSIPASPSSSSVRGKHRSALPFEFTSQARSVLHDDDSSAMTPGPFSHHSRHSSFSSSMTGSALGRGARRRRNKVAFPYGAAETGVPAGSSAASLASVNASVTRSLQPTTHEEQSRLKETYENSQGDLSRDFVKWSALRRIVAHVRAGTEADRVKMTVLAVGGGLIAVGTQGGRVIVCDFAQDMIASCGHDGQEEGDSVTAVAFSSDHTFLGVGHASGTIFLYDLKTPNRAARHIPPVPLSLVKTGRKEGHLSGSAILHIGFIGLRHTAIVTADSKGLAFYHALGKILGVSSNDTLRLLGKYPEYEHEDELGLNPDRKRSTIYQLSALPLGPQPHLADDTIFVAMITPTKMVLVGLKPSARTWWRKLNSETAFKARQNEKQADAVVAEVTEDAGQQQQPPACLAWFPASVESDGKRNRQTNPVLAFSFGKRLHLVRLLARKATRPNAGSNGAAAEDSVDELDVAELTGKEGLLESDNIVSLQWFNADLLLIATEGGLSLFDCRAGRVTERMEGGSAAAVLARTVEQRNYDAVIFPSAAKGDPDADEALQSRRAWTLNHSIRLSKGRSFFLTQNDLVVGSLLSWADRLLAYVSQGDFLLAIELATIFYQGKALGSAVGLPSDPVERSRIIGDKLRELMAASAEYTFSPDRLTDATHITADGRGVDRTSLFEGLARICATACLALGDMSFLFDQLYDKYEDNGIEGIFVGQMEKFIVSGELRSLPIPVVQRLIAFRRDREEYELAEQIIWHVDPKSLDLDQALRLCLDQKLYDALIYVYNSALRDFVSPIVELLEPLRRVVRSRRQILPTRKNILVGYDDPFDAFSYANGQIDNDEDAFEQDSDDAYRIFSYLAVVLVGLQYPSQEPIDSETIANAAKSSTYGFLTSGGCIIWPPGGGGKLVLYGADDDADGDTSHEPLYPYLRLLLEFDAEAFLDALDLAFEDSYLDDEEIVGKRLNRQTIVGILLELSQVKVDALPLIGRIFLCIFVARNAPKYSQFVRLTSQDVDHLLRSLAIPLAPDYSQESEENFVDYDLIECTREDRELAVEFLLSHYKPRFDDEWLSIFESACFQRILRSAFRQERKWDRLLALYIRENVHHPSIMAGMESDAGASDVLRAQEAFSHMEETIYSAFRAQETPASLKDDLHEQLANNVVDLLELDPLKTTALLDRFFPRQHQEVLHRLAQLDEQRLLLYLRCFFEPLQVSKDVMPGEQNGDGTVTYNADVGRADPDHLGKEDRKRYLDVLCRYDPEAVIRNLDARSTGYFDLENLVEECRKTHFAAVGEARVAQNSDVVLWALDRLGRPEEAFEELDRLVAATAESIDYLSARDSASPMIGALVADVRRSVDAAVRLCIERANTFSGRDNSTDNIEPVRAEKMDTDEVWFRLLRSLVRLVHDVAHTGPSTLVLDDVREIVQDTLANLVSSTAAEAVSFPALFRRLTGESSNGSVDKDEVGGFGAAAKYYAEVRSVLDGMLSAYHLRTELLGITNKLFERDTFVQFRRLNVQRKRGWRPSDGMCAHCGRPLIGLKRGAPIENAETVDIQRDKPGNGRERMSKDVSFSSIDSESLHRQVLSPAALQHRRRAKSSYDSKAAPLASPRADKGKGVVRSSSTGSNLDLSGSIGADEAIDDYFTNSFVLTDIDRSIPASGSGSLIIHDSPARLPPHTEGRQSDEEGSTGTMTPSRSQLRRSSSSSSTSSFADWGLSGLQALNGTAAGRIVIKKSGQMYHEGCFPASASTSQV